MKRASVALLLVGVALIAGSCAPMARLLWFDGDAAPTRQVRLPVSGESIPLELSETLTAAPMLRIEAVPGPLQDGSAPLRYSLSIARPAGQTVLQKNGSAALDAGAATAGGPTDVLALRFAAVTLPPGRWLVQLDLEAGDGRVRGAELQLLRPAPGAVSVLMTALVLAILGWLAAALGALQWIRQEAARPATPRAREQDSDRPWTVGCHLAALLGYIVPFGHLMGPMAVWLAKRHVSADVEQAGRTALNFQLSVTVYVLAALLLSFFLIGVVLLFVVVVFHFAAVVYASLQAQRGVDVEYPLAMKLI